MSICLKYNKDKFSFKYINWDVESEKVVMMNENFLKLKKSLSKENKAHSKTKRQDYLKDGAWQFEKTSSIASIRINEQGTLRWYCTNYIDDTKNQRDDSSVMSERFVFAGPAAYSAVKGYFDKEYNIGFKAAFGTVDEQIKACIPKQFYWINKGYIDKVVIASGIDFCSHYPTNLCGDMPDAHTAIEVNGKVEPTAEYPFAFYLKSQTNAEYGKYDTHDWIYSRFAFNMYTKEGLELVRTVKDEDEVTVLMKPSEYHFDEAMQYFYEKRKEDATAKLVMNAFIGMLHTKSYTKHKYAHIAAVAISRANQKMMELAETLRNPIHICVDGCVYLDDVALGGSEKALGLCEQEFRSCAFKMKGTNIYVVIDEGKVKKFKHGCYNRRLDGEDIDKVCTGFADMDMWYRDTTIKEEIENEEDN